MAKEKTVKMSADSGKNEVTTAFQWFHATSVNGAAMLIAAVIASYYSVFITDTLKIPAPAAVPWHLRSAVRLRRRWSASSIA